MDQFYLYSLSLESSQPVDPDNMRRSLQAELVRLATRSLGPPFSLVHNIELTTIPTPEKGKGSRGIEAAALVEIVNLKKQLAEVQTALESAQRQLLAVGR